jgi:hypothetical protein
MLTTFVLQQTLASSLPDGPTLLNISLLLSMTPGMGCLLFPSLRAPEYRGLLLPTVLWVAGGVSCFSLGIRAMETLPFYAPDYLPPVAIDESIKIASLSTFGVGQVLISVGSSMAFLTAGAFLSKISVLMVLHGVQPGSAHVYVYRLLESIAERAVFDWIAYLAVIYFPKLLRAWYRRRWPPATEPSTAPRRRGSKRYRYRCLLTFLLHVLALLPASAVRHQDIRSFFSAPTNANIGPVAGGGGGAAAAAAAVGGGGAAPPNAAAAAAVGGGGAAVGGGGAAAPEIIDLLDDSDSDSDDDVEILDRPAQQQA